MDNARIKQISNDFEYWEKLGTRPDMAVAMELLEEIKRLTEYVDPDVVVITESNEGYQYAQKTVLKDYEEALDYAEPTSYVSLGRILAQAGIKSVSIKIPKGKDEIFYLGLNDFINRTNDCIKNWSILINRKKELR